MIKIPEVVEVQIQVDGLSIAVGRTINSIIIHNGGEVLLKNVSQRSFRNIKGYRITLVQRIGKHILLELENSSDGNVKYLYLVVHLAMTGGFLFNKDHPHKRITFELSDCSLIYKDIRKFGSIQLLNAADTTSFFKGKNGIDALTSNPSEIKSSLISNMLSSKYQKITIYEALLDQQFISGLGNIYVNEVLWKSQINPMRYCKNLDIHEISSIASSIPSILSNAYNLGGSSIKDFVNVFGEKGNAQSEHKVYGKDHFFCPNCEKRKIESIIVKRKMNNGRTAFYCPKCQK